MRHQRPRAKVVTVAALFAAEVRADERIGGIRADDENLGPNFGPLTSKPRSSVLAWRDAYAVGETSAAVMADAVDLASDHEMRIWDSVILSVAASAECRLLLSEDLQDGFTWRGVTVTNPFGSRPHALLKALLDEGT